MFETKTRDRRVHVKKTGLQSFIVQAETEDDLADSSKLFYSKMEWDKMGQDNFIEFICGISILLTKYGI